MPTNFKKLRSAILTAKQSIELKKKWKEAFITIGNIYAAGASNCGSDFEKSTVYWVAVDYFTKALSDESTNERARKSINTYQNTFQLKRNVSLMEVAKRRAHMLLNAG